MPVTRQGVRLLTIWGVPVPDGHSWWCGGCGTAGTRGSLAAREMTAAEVVAHKAWEEARDE